MKRLSGGAILLAVLLLLASALPADACTIELCGITLGFEPTDQSVGLGSSVDVDIVIAGLGDGEAPSLSTFDLDVTYDPTILSLDTTDADSDGVFDSVVFGNGLDIWEFGFNSRGTELDDSTTLFSLNLFEVSLDDSFYLDLYQASSFTLATLTFDAIGLGTSPLEMSITELGDAWGESLTAEVTSGSISVVPEPASLLLLGVGLIGIAAFARRRKIKPV